MEGKEQKIAYERFKGSFAEKKSAYLVSSLIMIVIDE